MTALDPKVVALAELVRAIREALKLRAVTSVTVYGPMGHVTYDVAPSPREAANEQG